MQKLSRDDGECLTEQTLKLLSRNGIITVVDVLKEDPEKLVTITKLSLPEIFNLRSNILHRCSAPIVNGAELYDKLIKTPQFISTGIKRLDDILNSGIPVRYITEICGLADSGKTQFCLQIAITCAEMLKYNILYVNTKGDFSAIRVQKILEARGQSHKDMAAIMSRIQVVNAWNLNELLDLLDKLMAPSQLEEFKLIIVDSLPALMFQYLGDQSKISLTKLNVLANKCKQVAQQYELAVLIVNIQTRWIDAEPEVEDDDEEATEFREPQSVERRYRCLGRYWQHIPAIVLQLERAEDTENGTVLSTKVIKSSFGCSDVSCKLLLNNMGVT